MKENWAEVTNKETWEKGLSKNEHLNFLQSYAFGEFHRNLGNKVWRLGKADLRSFCQTVKLHTKAGSFFYIPGGPLLENWSLDLPELVTVLKTLGSKEGVSFIRFDPRSVGQNEIVLLQKLGLKKAPFYTQPQASLQLDLTQSSETLRKNLSDSTRYNIGWVERQGVEVKTSDAEKDIEVFLELLKETSLRQGFRLGEMDYYRKQYQTLSQEKMAKLYLTYGSGEWKEKVLSAAVVVYYAGVATYLHAASSSLAPKLRAPYLMQWRIINDAKEQNFKSYDFWGVASTEDPKDPWAGVSAFKQSFGGEKVFYQPPYDLVLSPSYYLQRAVEKLRKLIF